MQDFRKLQVWEKAHRFVLDIYRTSKNFPSDEKYGLTSQIRRASASIPTNIAEGCGRGGNREFAQFLRIAMGSASEVEYLLILVRDLDYVSPDRSTELESSLLEIKRMLNALIQKVQVPTAKPKTKNQ